MNVSLTAELEKFVDEKLRSGMYQTASEVVRESLRLLADQDRARAVRLDQLRAEVRSGVDQAGRGEASSFDAAAVARIKRRGRKKKR